MMDTKTKQEIEDDAKLAIEAMQLEDVCPYPKDTAAYIIWITAYKAASKEFHDAIDSEYKYLQELEHGHSNDRI